jgi:hypothetical protein
LNAIDRGAGRINEAIREWREQVGDDFSAISPFSHDARLHLHALGLNFHVIAEVMTGKHSPKDPAQYLGEFADEVLRELSEIDRFVSAWRLEAQSARPSS